MADVVVEFYLSAAVREQYQVAAGQRRLSKSSSNICISFAHHIFLIYKEIQTGAVAKSYMTNGLLIYGEIIVHFLVY